MLELFIQPTHQHVLDLHVVVDSVLETLAAGAGLLDTTKGSHLIGDNTLVDTHDAVFQRFGHTHRGILPAPCPVPPS